ncbi:MULTISPECIES: two-component system sensor histidine kinase CreC [Yersinia]|jgi:two-component system, OmpR family, sensor histidine kinase CreC|uniref:two-component system sensor histidine kinase CreC n=1 Tax=Yersinia TaxID=629 RepID=UPI0005E346D9|nr:MULTISPECIES: two-component system sensor histidine kinase CreC [Yersinia]ARB86311.1 two-component system sensor histidine kinase CreC [Yersinia sp. FDAARGOS_228]AVL36167.1 two-component system sensor histidine kinase CreC [Yersinia intermedia]MCB5299782.1 two-component system sensor histidine kinase CreC [Yersinia intermedia]MDA5482181.1 two-component system sensor histidine kinase CreC [Yersinia intermedia]MDN0115515.1 two-component system sensor histidine kinase CreC [Yersinia intermedia
MKIGVRLLLGYFLIVAIAGYFVIRIFVQEVKPGVRRATEGTLVDTATLLAQFARQDMLLDNVASGQLAQAFASLNLRPIGANIEGIRKDRNEYRVYLTDADGRVVFDSSGKAVGQDYSRWNDVWLTLRGEYGARSTRTNPADEQSSVMYVAAPVMAENKIIGVLSVGKPNISMAPVIKRSERKILLAGGVLLGIALLIGLGFVWWINRSIGKLVDYAERVAEGQVVALPAMGSSELHDLARALESMRLKLDGKAYIEQYVHTMTHELKSPLAAITGAAELLRESPPPATAQRFIVNIEQQSARIRQLVDKMLVQARLESRVDLQFSPLDISHILKQTFSAKEAQAVSRGICLQLKRADSAILTGDGLLLSQALTNLIDNALDFTPLGGAVILSGERHEGEYLITVEDNGSGIPDYAQEKIFDRFYSLPRADSPKSTGLGLNFVREVAAIHRGRISLENRLPQGVSAYLALPLEAA